MWTSPAILDIHTWGPAVDYGLSLSVCSRVSGTSALQQLSIIITSIEELI